MSVYPVIMCGGSGTRFWPLSREDRPKQFLQILQGESLFQKTVNRLTEIFPQEQIRVVAPDYLTDHIKRQVPFIDDSMIILEPEPRDTAACLGLSAAYLHRQEKSSGMIVLPSDHLIGQVDRYVQSLQQAKTLLEQQLEQLVCFGITPTRPATGYGYLKRGAAMKKQNGIPVFRVDSFQEKPDRQTASNYYESSEYFWNSGMFAWRTETFLDELHQYAGDIRSDIQSYMELRSKGNRSEAEEEFGQIRETSVDYAVMEQSDRVCMLETSFSWKDLGSLEMLSEILEEDERGNATKGNFQSIGCRNMIAYGCKKNHVLASVGIENTIVVQTQDATLVCARDRAQEVKKLVRQMHETEDQDQYL